MKGKKLLKKSLAVLLTVVLLLPMFGIFASAARQKPRQRAINTPL